MDNFEECNPMRDAFLDPGFNSYRNGPGTNLEVVPRLRSEVMQKTYKLYVGNLPTEFSQIGLENLFMTYGQPLDVFIHHNPEFDNKRTWGFVIFESYSEADAAIRDLDGKPQFHLKVQFAHSESKGIAKQDEEPELSHPLPAPESSYVRQMRGRGRGAIHPFVDPRVGMDYNPYVSEEVMSLRTFQNYGGSPYDYHNRMMMRQPRDAPGLYGPAKIAMGRGGFDRARDKASRHLEEISEGDMKEVLSLLENKIILNDPAGFSKMEVFDIKHDSCVVCKESALSVCEQCGAHYCSEKCQAADWPKHRIICQKDLGSSKGRKSEIKEVSSSASSVQTRDGLSGGDNTHKLPAGKRNSGTSPNKKYEGKNKADDFKENEDKPKSEDKVNGHKQWKQNAEFSPTGQEKRFNESDTGAGSYKNDKKVPSKNSKQNFNEKGQQSLSRVSPREGKSFGKKPDHENEQVAQQNFHKEGKQFSKKFGSESDFKSGKDQKSSGPKRGNDPNYRGGSSELQEGKEESLAYEELPRSHFTQVITVLPLGGFCYYVQLAEKQNSVFKWSIDLKESENTAINPSIGGYCAAKFENDWYRAKITSVDPLKVHFIDYGNDENCQANDLKTLPGTLKAHKAQAIKIRLAPGTPSKFKDLKTDEVLKVKLVKKQDGYNIVEVAGVEYSDSSDADAKCSSGVAQKKPNVVPFCNIITTLEVNSTGNLIIYEFDSLTFGIGTLMLQGDQEKYQELFNVLPKEFDSFPDEDNPVKGDVVAFRNSEFCGRGFVLKAEGELCVAACDTGEIFTDSKVKILPERWREIPWFMVKCSTTKAIITEDTGKEVGFEMIVNKVDKISNECQVTLKNHKNEYKATLKPWDPPYELYQEVRVCELKEGFCLMSAYKSARVCYVRPITAENINSCNWLYQRVAAECHKSQRLLRPPKVGEILGALYSIDENFFRARVLAVNDGKAKVVFLDYGNEDEVKFEDLRPLSQDLKEEKATAVKVLLENVRDRPLTKAAREFLDSFVADSTQKLQLTFSVLKNTRSVVLTVPNAKESVNTKLNQFLTPRWKDGPQDWAKVIFTEFPYETQFH